MRKLKIDIDEITMAMESSREDIDFFLDTETGKLMVLNTDLLDRASFGSGFPDEEGEDAASGEDDLEELCDCEPEELAVVRAIVGQDVEGGRYEQVPEIPSWESYQRMVRFAEQVDNPRLRELLAVALDGKGAFGRFNRVMAEHPEERQQWFSRKNAALAKEVREWLFSLGIEPE